MSPSTSPAIVVAMLDIYELGMPPESAPNRYGKENAEFIRNVICEKYPVDMSRIYITGFSIGAFVTADTAAADAGLFAAAAPLAYPGNGYMQIFPYEDYGTDADALDLPVLYLCGRNDRGNTMVNPQGGSDRVLAIQLFFNQLFTFNEMYDQKLDLMDFDYDLYPGENDAKTDRNTGLVTGGYDFWDGTAAQYITQNLDFTAYPFYGYDMSAIPNTTQQTYTTPEGIEYIKNVFYNDAGQPMLEHLVMGDMGHYLYTRYARLIWDDLFSKYSRDPDTGELTYYGATVTGSNDTITAAEADGVSIDVTYNGTEAASSVRVQLDSTLDIINVTSDYRFEYNPDNGKIVVYNADFADGTTLFTVEVDTSDAAPGTYKMGIEIIEVTGEDALAIDVRGVGGTVTVKPVKGDVNGDGFVNNADLIMIARYLVDLVNFNTQQKNIADYNDDGKVNSTDLVLIARAIVEK